MVDLSELLTNAREELKREQGLSVTTATAVLQAAEDLQLRLEHDGGAHSHRCIACQLRYTPEEGASEDCPRCGCDGTPGWAPPAPSVAD